MGVFLRTTVIACFCLLISAVLAPELACAEVVPPPRATHSRCPSPNCPAQACNPSFSQLARGHCSCKTSRATAASVVGVPILHSRVLELTLQQLLLVQHVRQVLAQHLMVSRLLPPTAALASCHTSPVETMIHDGACIATLGPNAERPFSRRNKPASVRPCSACAHGNPASLSC